MAIVNFSVPDDVKRRFDKAFAGMNKSAVVAQLMCQAAEERQRPQRRRRVIDRLLRIRRALKPVTRTALRVARIRGRP